ncbi:HAD domain-containing protein [Caballeronia sp. GAFFF1]|uniref:HAD domain-containing protein n=1 Tax=Caballeronia sp. GAFFF1 TaxID=2921779 RepID=UPI002028CF04|nr:HAD domain-containing protein [Caballeronia sp. GAFFF1]
MRQVLFLDYDGVLNPGDTYVTAHGIVSSAPGTIELFDFAPTLPELLESYSKIGTVLSTDWCLCFEHARDSIRVEGLRRRVTGATYEVELEEAALWRTRHRGVQILRYARRHNIASWLAVDDRRDGVLGYHDRLIHCQTESGTGDPAAIELFQLRLVERFGEQPMV